MAKAMREFTQVARAAQNEILLPPPTAPGVQELVVVPAALMEARVLSVIKEFKNDILPHSPEILT